MDMMIEFVGRTMWYSVCAFLYTRVSFKIVDCAVETFVHLIAVLIVSMLVAGYDVYVIFIKKE